MNREIILIGLALCGLTLTGCGARPTPASSEATAQAAPVASPGQHAQERARVIQTIRTMTPDQRAAWFRANPGSAATIVRQLDVP